MTAAATKDIVLRMSITLPDGEVLDIFETRAQPRFRPEIADEVKFSHKLRDVLDKHFECRDIGEEWEGE